MYHLMQMLLLHSHKPMVGYRRGWLMLLLLLVQLLLLLLLCAFPPKDLPLPLLLCHLVQVPAVGRFLRRTSPFHRRWCWFC